MEREQLERDASSDVEQRQYLGAKYEHHSEGSWRAECEAHEDKLKREASSDVDNNDTYTHIRSNRTEL